MTYRQVNLLVGIVVMLLGSGAFIGMVYYAMNRHFSEEAVAARIRHTRARFAEIEGSWITPLANGRVILQANEGVYQLIFLKAGSGIRRYSRGTAEADGDYLVFRPMEDFGKPEDSEGVTYYSWPMTAFRVQAARHGRKLVWQKGPPMISLPEKMLEQMSPDEIEELARKNNIVDPVFKMVDEDRNFIIWEPLN